MRADGCVIARQRPGTAKGFIFLSIEDETGIANVIVTPDLYDRDRLLVTRSKFLLVEGPLQNQDGVIHVKATRLLTLSDSALELQWLKSSSFPLGRVKQKLPQKAAKTTNEQAAGENKVVCDEGNYEAFSTKGDPDEPPSMRTRFARRTPVCQRSTNVPSGPYWLEVARILRSDMSLIKDCE